MYSVRRLTIVRRQKGWSQRTLGEMLSACGARRVLTQPEISQIELGIRNPQADELRALGRLFGVDPDRLLETISDEVPA